VLVLDRAALVAGLVRIGDVRDQLLALARLLAPVLLPADQLPPQAHLVEAEVTRDADDAFDPGVIVLRGLGGLLVISHQSSSPISSGQSPVPPGAPSQDTLVSL